MIRINSVIRKLNDNDPGFLIRGADVEGWAALTAQMTQVQDAMAVVNSNVAQKLSGLHVEDIHNNAFDDIDALHFIGAKVTDDGPDCAFLQSVSPSAPMLYTTVELDEMTGQGYDSTLLIPELATQFAGELVGTLEVKGAKTFSQVLSVEDGTHVTVRSAVKVDAKGKERTLWLQAGRMTQPQKRLRGYCRKHLPQVLYACPCYCDDLPPSGGLFICGVSVYHWVTTPGGSYAIPYHWNP